MNVLIVVLSIIIGLLYAPIPTLLLLVLVAVLAPYFARSFNTTITGR